MSHDPYREFRQAVDRPEDKIDLGRAALTIALSNYPNLDIAQYLGRIDRLAVEAAGHGGAEADVYRAVAALNYVLFSQQGYRGNAGDYYDPRNSFLNEVIERKIGIPITLSVLYLEVARRIGLALDGVNFPGHFLVKHESDSVELYIDPFRGGELKSREDLSRMLDRLNGEKVTFRPEFLATAGKKQILKRMLGNLKTIYLRDGDFGQALSVFDRLIILDPAAAEEIRDRGLVISRWRTLTRHGRILKATFNLRPMPGMRRRFGSSSPDWPSVGRWSTSRARLSARLFGKFSKAVGK